MTTATYDFAGFYTIVLTKRYANSDETIRKIFEDCWSLYIANANLLIPAEDYETILLYTFFPFTPSKCERVEPVIHDYFKGYKFALDAPIFPDKFHNFYKCPLQIATHHIAPYMTLKLQPNGSYEMGGIEGRMLKLMSTHLNFTPELLLTNHKSANNNANDSVTGLPSTRPEISLKMVCKCVYGFLFVENFDEILTFTSKVADGVANFTIRGLVVTAQRIRNHSPSSVYIFPTLHFAIPPGRPYTSIEKLYLPFTTKIWMSISVLFAIGGGVVLFLKLLPEKNRDFIVGKSNNMPFFNMINVCLGGGLNTKAIPMRNFARTLLLIWMISCLVLRNAYQGKLFDHIRSSQRMEPMYDINDLYASDFKLYVFEQFYSLIADILPNQEDRLILWRLNTESFHNLSDANFHGAYMTVAQPFDYFNFINFPNVNILKTKKDILMTQMCMFHRKYSSLVKPFDEKIGWYKTNGLIEYWIRKYKIPSFRQSDRTDRRKLSFSQISGVIIVCALLFVVSMILFILELMSAKCKKIEIFLDFLTFNSKQGSLS